MSSVANSAVTKAANSDNSDNANKNDKLDGKEIVTDSSNLKRPAGEPISAINDDDASKKLLVERIRRRKVAVVICYSGIGYLGLQRNTGKKTIEGDFLNAIKECGYINDEIYNTPQLIQFQRAARTDKGVSALRQVLSMKLPQNATEEEINKHLPDQIRVMAIRRVTKGFNSKSSCDGRTYSYMLPSFAFAPNDTVVADTYRIAKYIMEKVRAVIGYFQGTHNFHNFTSKKRFTDPSAKRFMINLQCSDPFVIDDMEFVTIYIKGQSFMLHQIRKMVGLTIAIVRGLAPEETILRAYDEFKLDIPIAPSAGLLLEEPHYERYNKRYGDDGIHQILEWSEYSQKFEDFRKQFVIPAVVDAEKGNGSYNRMKLWLETLPIHTFDVRLDSDENDDWTQVDDSTPKIDGLISLHRASELVEKSNITKSNETITNNLDTLAKAAAQAMNGEVKNDQKADEKNCGDRKHVQEVIVEGANKDTTNKVNVQNETIR